MELSRLENQIGGWRLHRHVTDTELLSIVSNAAAPDGSLDLTALPIRLYSYSRGYERGVATVNAWYHPGADPYGKYPFEIEFLFATADGELLRDFTIYEADAESQSTTVNTAVSDISGFFASKLALTLEPIVRVLGEAEDEADSPDGDESDDILDDSAEEEADESGRRRRVIRGI